MFNDKKVVSGFPSDGAIYAHTLIPKRDKSDTATSPSYGKENFATMQHAQNCKQLRLGSELVIRQNGLFPK